jgi:hypothetical protein
MKASEVRPGLRVTRGGTGSLVPDSTTGGAAIGSRRIGVTISGLSLLHGVRRGVIVCWEGPDGRPTGATELVAIQRLVVLGEALVLPPEYRIVPQALGSGRAQLVVDFPGLATPHRTRIKRRYRRSPWRSPQIARTRVQLELPLQPAQVVAP